MTNEDGSVRLVFNGEIYNFRELRERPRGARPPLPIAERLRKRSSTSTRRRAPTAIAELDGMFAFALWDDARQAADARARSRRQEAAVLLPRRAACSRSRRRSRRSSASRHRASSVDPDARAVLLHPRLRAGPGDLLPARVGSSSPAPSMTVERRRAHAHRAATGSFEFPRRGRRAADRSPRRGRAACASA